MTIEKGKDWLERYTKASGREHPFEKVYRRAREEAAERAKVQDRGNMQPYKSSKVFHDGENAGWDFISDRADELVGHPNAAQSYSAASRFKADVCNYIADQTGIPANDASLMIHQWAATSNDTSPASLSIHEAAAEEFGVSLSEWQKEKADLFNRGRNVTDESLHAMYTDYEAANSSYKAMYAEYKQHAYHYGGKWYQVFDLSPAEKQEYETFMAKMDAAGKAANKAYSTWSQLKAIKNQVESQPALLAHLPDPRGAVRKALRAMYERTQEQFRKAGVTEMVLYRGFHPEGEKVYKKGQAVKVRGNALESWSSSYDQAKKFGTVVMAIRVPVARILSSPASGFGCMGEQEFVLLGPTGGEDMAHIQQVLKASKYHL